MTLNTRENPTSPCVQHRHRRYGIGEVFFENNKDFSLALLHGQHNNPPWPSASTSRAGTASPASASPGLAPPPGGRLPPLRRVECRRERRLRLLPLVHLRRQLRHPRHRFNQEHCVCEGEGVHGRGVHGGIRGYSWKAFHILVPPGLRGYSDHRGAPMGACGCRRESPFAWVQTWCRKARHRGHCEEVRNPAYKFWNPRILTANYNSGILLNIFPSSHQSQFCFTQRYLDVKKVLADTFLVLLMFGVYSPSVQNTLYLMAKEVLTRLPDIASVQLRMPNLHFLPVNLSSKENPGLVKFADDVHMPTDEPHGTIEATLSRANSKL